MRVAGKVCHVEAVGERFDDRARPPGHCKAQGAKIKCRARESAHGQNAQVAKARMMMQKASGNRHQMTGGR